MQNLLGKNRNSFLFFVMLLLLTLNVIFGGIFIRREYPSILFLLSLTPAISEEEKTLITNLANRVSATEYQESLQRANIISKESPSIEIGNCSPYPRILKTSSTQPVKMTNSDSKEHTITLLNQQKVTLPPGKSTTLSFAEIERVPLILGYGCDNRMVGALYITY